MKIMSEIDLDDYQLEEKFNTCKIYKPRVHNYVIRYRDSEYKKEMLVEIDAQEFAAKCWELYMVAPRISNADDADFYRRLAMEEAACYFVEERKAELKMADEAMAMFEETKIMLEKGKGYIMTGGGGGGMKDK